MSNNITILFTAPAILTKDKDWAKSRTMLKPGAIVVLPDDAVLVVTETEKA